MSVSGARAAALFVVLGFAVAALGQTGRVYTTADYQRAESFMNYSVDEMVLHKVEHPAWLADGRFWYSDLGEDGITYRLVDPVKGSTTVAFDREKLAAAANLLPLPKTPPYDPPAEKLDAKKLKITEMIFEDGDKTLTVTVAGRKLKCDLTGAVTCKVVPPNGPLVNLSPDGKKAIFQRDSNLWLRDIASGKETQLTTDGVKDYGYGTTHMGVGKNGIQVSWSPDQKKIAVSQVDERKIKEMYLVPVVLDHPELAQGRYAFSGDPNVRMAERVVIDLESKKVVRLKMAPEPPRGSGGYQWTPDGSHIAFLSQSRDFHQVWLRLADTETGEVRQLLTETVPTFYENADAPTLSIGPLRISQNSWRYLPETKEILWFSERDDWGNLYLYDLATGKVKNQITHGAGNVKQVLRVDEKARVIYFVGVGRQKGWDSYYNALYKVNFDGTGLQLLTPEVGDHSVLMSPDGKFYSDMYSTALEPGKAAIHAIEGKIAVDLPSEDISKLKASGWVPPTPITVKARDGKTDLYGFLFKPTNFDPKKKYPIVNYIYPGPQVGSCGATRGFLERHGAPDMQSLAELGFITVCIDGMGTPSRTKTFHDAQYNDMGDNTLPDQIAGMKELAAKYPWIDLNRAGIWGHSGGGSATAEAMFRYPDFFKVGISESGNHDNRIYNETWSEKYWGLEVIDANGKSNYASHANEEFAKNLKGHLLLAHGTMDDNVAPNNTLLVVAALIKANKDFDLIMIPNRPHAYGPDANYMTRRRWDYFVRYLAEGTPPHEYQMKPPPPTPTPGEGADPEYEADDPQP
jgi:dipeptidyl aminopeptidase/acylaminoacyl peptidase